MMYERVLKEFNIQFKRLRTDKIIEGSPERCASRAVVEDKKGKLYVIELIKENQKEKRQKIAETLRFLKESGIKEINPYIYHEGFIHYNWMVQEYLENIPLKRPEYIRDSWRAQKASEFLAKLKTIEVPTFDKKDVFDIKAFIADIQKSVEKNRPEIANVTGKYAEYIIKNLPDDMPVSFCHGDFHPINILWGENDIISVIDWEFCGYKHEIYDLANILGCIGIENPKYLESEFATILINNLRKSYSKESFKYLNIYILALRFGWLSEWLRKKDEEMIKTEIEFMKLLI